MPGCLGNQELGLYLCPVKKTLLFLLLAVSAVSCFDQGDCLDYSTNLAGAVLLDAQTGTSATVAMDSIVVDGVNLPQYTSQSISSFRLPLNSTRDSVAARFYYEGGYHSLTLRFVKSVMVLSPRCGARTYFKELTVAETTFNQVLVTNSKLLNTTSVNIKIYL